MSLLSPIAALVAASITIPALLLLYMLKLRRRQVRIASTLLWRQAFEDLQANVPFQRIRWSWLLLVQLLALLALLLAFAQPMARSGPASAARLVLVIDRSASMNTRMDGDGDPDPPNTRLDAAKRAAAETIGSLGEPGGPEQIMVVAFGAQPRVISSFESRRDVLREAVEAIEPSDETGDLEAALQLASGYAGAADESAAGAQDAADVMLFSDGATGARAGQAMRSLRSGRFSFIQVEPIGEDRPPTADDNVGIASIGVRRNPEDPARALVFARLVNAASQARTITTTVLVDDEPAATVQAEVPAASDRELGERSITTTVDLPAADAGTAGNVIVVRHSTPDHLPDDDVAAAVLPPPRPLRLAVIHPDDSPPDRFLTGLLDAMEPQSVAALNASRFAQIEALRIDAAELYDFIVFDRVGPVRLPAVPTLTVGAVPAVIRPDVGEDDPASQPDLTGRHFVSWDRQHPIMRNLTLDSVVFAGFEALRLGPGATPLAYGPDGPVIALLRARGVGHVVVGFELRRSDWPLHLSSLLFIQNMVEHLAPGGGGDVGLTHRPGEPISVKPQPNVELIRVQGPVIGEARVLESGTVVSLPTLPEAGVYEVDGAAPPHEVVALSVLSDEESDNRPRASVDVAAETGQGVGAAAGARALWPWLVACALGLLALEWLMYCRRAAGW